MQLQLHVALTSILTEEEIPGWENNSMNPSYFCSNTIIL